MKPLPDLVLIGAVAASMLIHPHRVAAFQSISFTRSIHHASCGQVQRKFNRPFISSRLYSTLGEGQNAKLMRMRVFAPDTTDNEIVPSTWSKAMQHFFLGNVGPPLVILSITGFIHTRLQLAQPLTITDATIVLATMVIWWIQEYFFHRVLLHSPFDWIGKSIHKTHHERDYFHVSIDPPALLLGWLFVAHFLLKSLMPWHLCLTATIGYAIAGLFYEWSHYIVHTRVKAPVVVADDSLLGFISSAAAKLFSQMRNNHIRHHRVDDRYWYAFSVPSMDDAFGTNPDIKELHREQKSITRSE